MSVAYLLHLTLQVGAPLTKMATSALFLVQMSPKNLTILNPKLIVSDDYQQFWVHFKWFLALFHISYEKWLLFKQKLCKNGTGCSFLKPLLVGLKPTS